MKLPHTTATLRILSAMACTSLMACGGGGSAGTVAVASPASAVVAVPVVNTATAGESTVASAGSAAAAATRAADTAIPDTATTAGSSITTTSGAATAVTTGGASVAPGAGTAVTAPQAPPVTTTVSTYGTYLRPYAVNSLWNSRPVNPVFGTFVIPTSLYFPAIGPGAYSTGIFLAASTDQPMTVVGVGSTDTVTVGVPDPDIGGSRVITIPRWPAGVIPASGTDGHADIVDPVTNTIHSFWQLKHVNGRWTAALYSWSSLTGTGWGDPAHYYQGARAVGITASAGLIRKNEIKDGLPTYTHALAMSLTNNALANGASSPAYIFPATSADYNASNNTGAIPEGALLMLPANFDSSGIVNADLKKVVETLKLYGGYVVDRNDGTPFTINVENDSGFNLMPSGWDNTIASQLDLIRANLRQVVSAQSWVDGNGNSAVEAIKAQQNMNILSMRGPWAKQSGTAAANYDSAAQSLVFDATTTKSVQVNASNTGLTNVKWAQPAAGSYFRFTVIATGGAMLRMQVKVNGAVVTDTLDLASGQSLRFQWPANASLTLMATSGTSGASTVRADLVPAP